MVKTADLTPEEIAATLNNSYEKKMTLAVLHAFLANGLTYQTKTAWKPKNSAAPDSYRVFCYIKKSKEAMILNTEYYDDGSFLLQVRILDSSTFDKLDELSENIRNQILHAYYDCKNCGCSEKAYVFQHEGHEYRKCRMLCGNFRLSVRNDEDIESVMDIINREIVYGMSKRRN